MDARGHVRGKSTGAPGDGYDGEWAAGEKYGEVVLRLADGTKFKGHFKEGMKNGKGVEEAADGTRFEGSFFNDQKDGSFVEKDKTGKVIRKGIYSRGKLMGQ